MRIQKEMADSFFIIFLYSSSSVKKAVHSFFGYILEFNHLLLYNFHQRNYSISAKIILSAFLAFDDLKGTLIDNHIYDPIGTTPEAILSGFERSNEFGMAALEFQNFASRSNGFLLSITDFFVYELTMALAIFGVGMVALKMTWHYRFSLLFRPYSFLAFFIVCLFDGKV